MNIFQSIILGIVQGITEFLPISSSGHLVILERIFKISQNIVLLNLVLHLGTALAVISFFWKDLIKIWKEKDWILIKNLFVAFVVTSIFGFLIKNIIEKIFINNLSLIPLTLGFIFTAIILLFVNKLKGNKELKNLRIFDTIKIGLAQVIALAPGISRSGITYITTLKSGIKKEDAFKFSFLLSIPTILGATFVESITGFKDILININLIPLVTGLIISFIFGILGIYIFKYIIKTSKMWVFSIYLICLAIILLIV